MAISTSINREAYKSPNNPMHEEMNKTIEWEVAGSIGFMMSPIITFIDDKGNGSLY